MKCRDCGQDGFKSPGEVKKHKETECPAHNVVVTHPDEDKPESVEVHALDDQAAPKEQVSVADIERMAASLGMSVVLIKGDCLVIPHRFLPEHAKYLGINNYMGIKVRGYLQKEGLVVHEPAEYIY